MTHEKDPNAGTVAEPRPERPAPSGRPESPESASAPDAASLLRSLRRRWPTALGLGLALALASALAVWTLMPAPKFVARATLHAASVPPSLLPGSGGGRSDFSTYVRTQTALIKSRMVLDPLLAKPGIAGLGVFKGVADPAEWLEKEIGVDPTAGTELLRVSLKGDAPEEIARLLDGLVATYLDAAREQEARERAERLRKLTESFDRYMADRSERREALKAFSEKVGSNDPKTLLVKQELDMERLEAARRELLFLQSDLRKARVELGVIEAQARLDPDESASAEALANEVASDPMIAAQVSRIAQLEEKLSSARRAIKNEGDPAIQRVRQQMESARRNLDARRAEVVESAGRKSGALESRKLGGRIASARERVAILEEHEKLLRAEAERLDQEARSTNRESIGLEDSRSDFDQADDMVRKVAAEIETQRVEQVAPPRIKLLEKATVPALRDARPRIKATAGAAGGAFLLVLLVVVWGESQAGRVESTDAVKRRLGLKLLGVLPRLGDRERRNIRRPDSERGDPRASLYFESIDATRALLLRALDDRKSAVVLISSAVRAEGKTSLSCHIAASLARAGRSTVLVDGDLRIPTAHKRLGIEPSEGLSEALRGDLAVAEAIRPTGQAGLMFLGAGDCDELALDALGRDGVAAILDELRRRFDVVVVDTSPILPVADPIHLARHADAVVLAVLEGVSTVPTIRDALDRLAAIHAPTIGAVVAGSPMLHYKYQFYRKPPKEGRTARPKRLVHAADPSVRQPAGASTRPAP